MCGESGAAKGTPRRFLYRRRLRQAIADEHIKASLIISDAMLRENEEIAKRLATMIEELEQEAASMQDEKTMDPREFWRHQLGTEHDPSYETIGLRSGSSTERPRPRKRTEQEPEIVTR